MKLQNLHSGVSDLQERKWCAFWVQGLRAHSHIDVSDQISCCLLVYRVDKLIE